jgi:hypothetical protein
VIGVRNTKGKNGDNGVSTKKNGDVSKDNSGQNQSQMSIASRLKSFSKKDKLFVRQRACFLVRNREKGVCI